MTGNLETVCLVMGRLVVNPKGLGTRDSQTAKGLRGLREKSMSEATHDCKCNGCYVAMLGFGYYRVSHDNYGVSHGHPGLVSGIKGKASGIYFIVGNRKSFTKLT